MILYKLNCPVHKTEMTVKETELTTIRRVDGTEVSEPVFYCDKCRCYYRYKETASKTERQKSNIVWKGRSVYFWGQPFVKVTGVANNSIRPTPVSFSFSKPGSHTVQKTKPERKESYRPTEKVIRIKPVSEDEIEGSKLSNNIDNIRKSFPLAFPERMTFLDFVKRILPNAITQEIVVRNISFIGSRTGNIVRRAELYNLSSSYLKGKLPSNSYIVFGGRVSNGEFIIDEMRLRENPILKDDDIQTMMEFRYDGENKANWLYEITEEAGDKDQRLVGELASWDDYLDWKRQLAELRIRGLKYIGFKIDIEAREAVFLTASDGEEDFKDFTRFLRRGDVSVFSNNYSTNRWRFEFNRGNKESDDGISLAFTRIGRRYDQYGVNAYEWDEMREYSKTYKSDEEPLQTRSFVNSIIRQYQSPYFAEIIFELSADAVDIINRQLRRNGALEDNIGETLAGEFYGDGYIATSQIGDFALISRLKGAVQDLTEGRGASQGLEQWLFDIKKAREPQNLINITEWQNPNINIPQKRAVEKILSVPDVCLIQGPPGTGKTTVIAEAIYQLVIRNKRVLVASQANLAVDNALERIISNPKIRAIRLGNARKIDSSVSNITEGNVLETFYDSIVQYVDKKYVFNWNKIDAYKQGGEHDLQRFRKANNDIAIYKGAADEKKAKIQTYENDNTSELIVQLNALRSEKMSLTLLKAYCNEEVAELELMLDKAMIAKIWNNISEIIKQIQNKGLWLTRVGIDIDGLNNYVRISAANDILKFILINAKKAKTLYQKLNSGEEFGGDTAELEELKIREKLVKEQVLTNPDPGIIAEWQDINRKINEFSARGVGFTESEKDMFDRSNLDNLENKEQRKHIISVIEQVLPYIDSIHEIIRGIAAEELERIEAEISQINELSAAGEAESVRIKEEITNLETKINDAEHIKAEILKKYKASEDTLESQIIKVNEVAQKKFATDISRSVWEDIFRGLEDWVEKIPDYSQEKDIYLKDYINGCNVVGVSCTENARTLLENGFDYFDVVIIDEVSKATPPELLIPMLRGRKIVLVGDHRQLPPLFNEHEKTYQEVAEQQEDSDDIIVPLTMEDFNKYKDMVTSSLFERYFENAADTIKETLSYQYRMHTDIMDIINIFYDGHLIDGNEDNYTYDTKAHYLDIPSAFGAEMIVPERHAYWFDSSELAGERIYEQRKAGSSSAENLVEAEIIIELLKKVERKYANIPDIKTPVSVGVISFYFDQVALIRQKLRGMSFHYIDIEVNTVDRFQGKEKEIVFVSLVRNVRRYHHSTESHIAAFQRINVAFSRAQNLLVIVGAKDMYADQPVKITDMNSGEERTILAYKEIIEMLDQRGTFFTSGEVISDIRADEILTELKTKAGGEER